MQIELHPSLSSVFKSSHSSFIVMYPSPHTSMQISGLVGDPPEHEYPVTEPVQSASQLDELSVSPSSHSSVPALSPSPHSVEHRLGSPAQ